MATPVKRPTNRASKDQLLAAFDQLNTEYKKLAASPKETTVPSAPNTNAASHNGDAQREDATLEQTISALLALRAGFGGAVSGISAKLTAEASRLTALRREVDEKTQQLAALHEIKVGDDTLEAVIVEHRTTSEAYERELEGKQKAAAAELEARTAAWNVEKEERARAVAERD